MNNFKSNNNKLNIIYFTLDDFDNIKDYHSINSDLLREFKKNGHNVFVVSPSEKKKGFNTRVIYTDGIAILKPRIGNIQKTNIIEKGISTLTIGSILKKAIKKEFKDVVFDLILYCTPPITFLNVVKYIKSRDNAKTYLLLKDIFPQNAVDLGLLKTTGIKGFIYQYFRNIEKKLYDISDYIGCMSQANVDYVIRHNTNIDSDKVEICPNSIELIDKSIGFETRNIIRNKYNIPLDKVVFIYGGNLGKVQGITFLVECLKLSSTLEKVFFLIVGDGTEYHILDEYINSSNNNNVKLLRFLPKMEYEQLVGACDVGLIFLDYKNTIPNFPSRLLSYMQSKIPVLAATDISTDIGKVIENGDFGWWCESNDAENFVYLLNELQNEDIKQKGINGYNYLYNNFSVEDSYKTIMKHI